VLEHQLATKIK